MEKRSLHKKLDRLTCREFFNNAVRSSKRVQSGDKIGYSIIWSNEFYENCIKKNKKKACDLMKRCQEGTSKLIENRCRQHVIAGAITQECHNILVSYPELSGILELSHDTIVDISNIMGIAFLKFCS